VFEGWLPILTAGGVVGRLPVTALLALRLQPAILHGSDTLVGELESIISQELDLVVPQEEDESFGDIASHLDVSQVVAADQFGVASNLKVVLVDFENHPDTRIFVTRGTD
jgi:hypothetical protein